MTSNLTQLFRDKTGFGVTEAGRMRGSEKSKLAVFTNNFPGLVNTFFARDMRALLEAGFEIDVFPFYPLDAKLWRYVPSILDESVLHKNKIHHLGFLKSIASLRPWPLQKLARYVRDVSAITASAVPFGLIPLGKSLYVFPKAWGWSRDYANRYDHILAYWGNYAATCAYLFHRLMDRPVPFSMFLHAGIDLYQDQVYLRQKLLYADNIIVVCDFNRQFIQNRYPDIYPLISNKIYEYHLGLDLEHFPYRPKGRPPRKVLGVGSLVKYKGYEHLVEATSELRRRGVDCELELVGEGVEENSLRALTKKLLIADKVTFAGWLPPADVRTAMENATVFVHPSNGVGDAVPTVIKECMALGTPVVASRTAGIPELLDGGRCGILVTPGDAKAFADAIQLLLDDNELRRRYVDAARKYAEEKFNLWRNGAKLAEIIHLSHRKNLEDVPVLN